MHVCLFVLASMALVQAPLEPRTQLNYQGTLAAADAESQAATLKPFDLTCWVQQSDADGTRIYWLLDERGRGEWSWPDRFGQAAIDAKGHASGDPPTLLYDRPERRGAGGMTPAGKDVVPLLLPIVATAQPLAIGAEWRTDRFQFHVDKKEEHAGHAVWQTSLADNFGPKGTAWIDEHSPLVVALNQRLTLGRGDQYLLKLELVGSEQLDVATFAALGKAFDAALALRGKLARPRQTPEIDWKPEELAILKEGLPAVEQAAAGTPLAKVLATAGRDLKLQTGRSGAIAELAKERLGSRVEPFEIRGFGDESLKADDLPGQVTVLHFWEYRDEPLKEPYGQVGYLDYLHHRRKGGDVRIYGVAVDGRLADDATRPTAERSVRKLKEFMNLSYPVLLDSGGLLKKFGDPRVLGATLPLFVVLGRDGKIAHYHVGQYDVHQDQGLKELDDAVLAEILKGK